MTVPVTPTPTPPPTSSPTPVQLTARGTVRATRAVDGVTYDVACPDGTTRTVPAWLLEAFYQPLTLAPPAVPDDPDDPEDGSDPDAEEAS